LILVAGWEYMERWGEWRDRGLIVLRGGGRGGIGGVGGGKRTWVE